MSDHFLSFFSKLTSPRCIFFPTTGTSQIPTIIETVITMMMVTYCDALIPFASSARVVPIPDAAFAAAIAS